MDYLQVGMASLIQARNTYSQTKMIGRLNNGLHNEGSTLKIEIELDESRSGSPDISKRQKLQDVESRENKTGKILAETIKTAQKQVAQASKEAEKETDKEKATNGEDSSKANKDTLNTDASNTTHKSQESKNINNSAQESAQQQQAAQDANQVYRRINVIA